MPVLVRDIVTGVRDYLGRPSRERLANPTILQRAYDELDDMRTDMNLPNVGRYLQYKDIDIGGSGTGRYLIQDISWGNIVLVQTWSDTTDYTPCEVPVTGIQDQDQYYIGPRVLSSYNSSEPHNVAVFTFTRDEQTGGMVAYVKPDQPQTARYRVWFQPDRPAPPTLNQQVPIPEQFSNLWKVRTALSCLPEIAITDKNHRVLNIDEIKLRGETLNNLKNQYMGNFEEMIQSMSPAQGGARIGWNYVYSDGLEGYE